jgi:hypothetical protein
MDFIARAGSHMERAHFLVGVVLLVLAAQTWYMVHLLGVNSQLNARIDAFARNQRIYVVPGSQADVYAPGRDELLVQSFTDYVTRNLNTYTYETYARQYNELRPFFTATMLREADPYFERDIKNTSQLQRSAFFLPINSTLTVEKRIEEGRDRRYVTIEGRLDKLVAGDVAETVPVRISMVMERVLISRSNPFGFQLASYNIEEIDPRR